MTNNIEIRVYGLMRSGNHAIIGWLQKQHTGKTLCFLNNIKHGNFDPFVTYKQIELHSIPKDIDIEELRSLKKHLLIFSYEDRSELEETDKDFITSIFDPNFEAKREKYLGKSEHRIDLSIIRDPFNCIASRIQLISKLGSMGGVSDMQLVANNWKRQAEEAICLTEYPEPNRIVAKYNTWIADTAYRKELSSKLMATSYFDTHREISPYGGGSSFGPVPLSLSTVATKWKKLLDPKEYRYLKYYFKRLTAKKISRADLIQRWTGFTDDEQFRGLFADRELLELSESLFGELPGTRDFVASI